MIKSIGFENFRRFEEFPPIDLGDVTLLVGGNNSGKSTLVKALLLSIDNLRMMKVGDISSTNFFAKCPQFRFDANEYHDAKVKSFVRALHNKVKPYAVHIYRDDEGKLRNEKEFLEGEEAKDFAYSITFKIELDHFRFEFEVRGDRYKESSTAYVNNMLVEDKKNGIDFACDYENSAMIFRISKEMNISSMAFLSKSEMLSSIKSYKRELAKATEKEDLSEIAKITASIEKEINSYNVVYGENISSSTTEEEIDSISEKTLKELEANILKSSALMPLEIRMNESNELVAANIISNLIEFASTPSEVAPELTGDISQEEYEGLIRQYEHRESSRQLLREQMDKMKQSRAELINLLSQLDVQYISAHAANQNTLYSTNDRNDFIAQVVHEFYREKINPGDAEYLFVKKWMKTFEIGTDFKVIPLVPGEAYKVDIVDEDGSIVPLADKGMGSIQMMILLLKLATIRHLYRYNVYPTTILIEEPEQNLHPKMQSLLADLFAELAKDKKMQFIIETHSEYLVRKSQVLVAETDYKDDKDLNENNPFKVYYLPTGDESPYEMKFTTSGRFSNKFGEGFFDTAGQLNLITLRKERGLQ